MGNELLAACCNHPTRNIRGRRVNRILVEECKRNLKRHPTDIGDIPGRDSFIVFQHAGSFRDAYVEVTGKFSEHRSSTVKAVEHKRTGAERVIYTVRKPCGQTDINLQINVVKREELIRKVINHPNILRLHEIFENERDITYVLESYQGCDLFNGIADAQCFAERQAAKIMRQILSVVAYLHSSRIFHRDLNNEVFSFSRAGPIEGNTLKLINTSRATFFAKGPDNDMTLLGHSYFTAPEAWTTEYNHAIDLWSCGVILYCLLCGHLPFDGADHTEVVSKIKSASYTFPEFDWGSISMDAKDLVTNLLQVRYWERATVEEALEHTWVKDLAPKHRLDAFGKSFFEALCLGPRRLTAFKEVALHLVSGTLDEAHIESLHKIFQGADRNGNGYLSFQEIADSILHSDTELPSSVYHSLKDINSNGCRSDYISFSEFLAMAVDNSDHLTNDLLFKAFNHFDLDGSGTISLWELQATLRNPGVTLLTGQDPCNIEELFEDVDLDRSGVINFDEFRHMMLNNAILK